MTTPMGQKAISGVYIGGLVSIAPPALALLASSGNFIKDIIVGLFVSKVTNGQWNSVFNILITSPRLWQLMLYTIPIGSAISVISVLGFYFAEGRCPNYQDLFERTSYETSEA